MKSILFKKKANTCRVYQRTKTTRRKDNAYTGIKSRIQFETVIFSIFGQNLQWSAAFGSWSI